MTDTCKTCRFWNRLYQSLRYVDGRYLDTGECRIRSTAPTFPKHDEDDWCGEHEQEPAATTVTLLESDNEIIDELVMPPRSFE